MPAPKTMQLGCTARADSFALIKTRCMEAFLKIYLPVFITGYVLLAFVAPSVKVYRQTGINPFRFATKHNAVHDYVGGAVKVFIGVLLAVVAVYSFAPSAYAVLAPFGYLNHTSLKITGLALGHLSLGLILVAQRHMRQSWRIGIDYENRTALVTTGLFRFSRNPVYAALLAGLTGLFLLLPNAATFAVLFAAYLLLHITMRLEEDFLFKQHGDAYAVYKSKVPRLL